MTNNTPPTDKLAEIKGVKVKNWYYKEPTSQERKENPYWTGIIMELENGLCFRQCSTDPIQPYSFIKLNESR